MKKKRLYIYCFLILIAILAIVFYSIIQPLILHPKFINACYEGDLEFVSNNIERIDLDHRDSYGRTGLMLAAWKGHYDIVRLLMDHGVPLFAEDNDGDTALFFAALDNSERCLKVIYDAMINSLDKENAPIERLSDQFRILVLYGFDYYVRDPLSKGMIPDLENGKRQRERARIWIFKKWVYLKASLAKKAKSKRVDKMNIIPVSNTCRYIFYSTL